MSSNNNKKRIDDDNYDDDYDDDDNQNNENNENNEKKNYWDKFTGNCIVALIFTLILGIFGANLVFLAKIAARQGKPDCWGNKEDSDGNTLTLLDIYYPTDEEMVPYKGICPPVLVEDYEQFRLGEYYPCGKDYDVKSLRMKNWWMLLMQSSGFRRVGRPYNWMNPDNNTPIGANIASLMMSSFIHSRGSFKDAMFMLTYIPDYILMGLCCIIIMPLVMMINAFFTIGGGYISGFNHIFEKTMHKEDSIFQKIKKIILFILFLPVYLTIPFIFMFFTQISLILTFIFQPILTDAHLIFNILRCNSKTLALIFSFFVCIAASHSLKNEISNTMNGVFIVLLLINLVGSFS